MSGERIPSGKAIKLASFAWLASPRRAGSRTTLSTIPEDQSSCRGGFVAVGIGIGPALRKARLLQGKSIEEASRETRIRAEYLQALERERFDALLGDVYVRGFLRSYSTYLGLDADKVLTVYNRTFGGPRPTLPEPVPGPARRHPLAHPHLPMSVRDHPSWAFMIGVALLVLSVFGVLGLLSRSRSAPRAANVADGQASIPVLPPEVTVDVKASQEVHLVVRSDGRVEFDQLLREGEGRSFVANSRIEIELDGGGLATITVNGHSLGKPGTDDAPYSATFFPQSYRQKPAGKSP
jgi:cytoskeleton protein RodZ